LVRYAEHTQVSITSTVTEIDRLLDRYGADGFMYGTRNTEAQIMFVLNNRLVRLLIGEIIIRDSLIYEKPVKSPDLPLKYSRMIFPPKNNSIIVNILPVIKTLARIEKM